MAFSKCAYLWLNLLKSFNEWLKMLVFLLLIFDILAYSIKQKEIVSAIANRDSEINLYLLSLNPEFIHGNRLLHKPKCVKHVSMLYYITS